jgi:hypothetical protein
MAGNAVSFTAPRLDDTAQRLLYKIASYLYVGQGFSSAIYGTGSPSGGVIPAFSGQLYEDTAAQVWYRSNGTTNTSWQLA